MALIQLDQHHHQSARYRGFHSKKLRSQQDGRMKKHLYNFMIGQFKRTFQTIYLDEICCFLYVYVYMLQVFLQAFIATTVFRFELSLHAKAEGNAGNRC